MADEKRIERVMAAVGLQQCGVRGMRRRKVRSKSRTSMYATQGVEFYARLDTMRGQRTGIPEVVFAPGKTAEQVACILEKLAGESYVAMATRVESEVAAEIHRIVPAVEYYAKSKVCLLWKTTMVTGQRVEAAATGESGIQLARVPPEERVKGRIVVLSAGTADQAVAEEACLTAEVMGCDVRWMRDVGVAGLHRLLSVLDDVREANVVIVAAGMDAALPSVVAGLVEAPVVAVPTSIGYGASLGGISAMFTALNACAPGVSVVNIDNGFGAAVVAIKMLKSTQRLLTSAGDSLGNDIGR